MVGVCVNCGARVSIAATFCGTCGAPVAAEDRSPVLPPYPQPTSMQPSMQPSTQPPSDPREPEPAFDEVFWSVDFGDAERGSVAVEGDPLDPPSARFASPPAGPPRASGPPTADLRAIPAPPPDLTRPPAPAYESAYESAHESAFEPPVERRTTATPPVPPSVWPAMQSMSHPTAPPPAMPPPAMPPPAMPPPALPPAPPPASSGPDTSSLSSLFEPSADPRFDPRPPAPPVLPVDDPLAWPTSQGGPQGGPQGGQAGAWQDPPDRWAPAPPPRARRADRRRLAALVAGVVAAVAVSGVLVWRTIDGPSLVPAASDREPTTAAAAPLTATLDAGSEPTAAAEPTPLTPASVAATCQSPNGVDSTGASTSYEPAKVTDGLPDTAWRCDGDATGQSLTLTFDEPVLLTSIGLIPGMAKTDPADGADRFLQNRRITSVRYEFDSGSATHIFTDSRELQWLTLDEEVQTTTVRVVILGTVAGGTTITNTGQTLGPTNKTPISEIQLLGSA